MPVMPSAPVLVRETSPLVALVALKLETVLAAFKVVPPTELVVKRAPLKSPAPVSETVPAVPVKERLLELVILPVLKVTLRPAVAEIAPEVLEAVALTKISELPPFAVKVTVPEPPAVTVLPRVCVPLEVKLILPLAAVLIAPEVVMAPVLPIVIFPVFCEMPAMVKGAAVSVREILPAPVLVAVKLLIVLALPSVVPPTEVVIKVGPESAPL